MRDIVKNVISEIKTESSVTSLQTQTHEKYELAVKHHLNGKPGSRQANLNNFQEVKKQVEDWAAKGQLKRGVSPIPQKNRDSLQKMYELHSNLSDEKDKLLESLNAIRKLEEAYFSRQVSRPSLKEIKKSLQTIRWNQKNIRITRQGGQGRRMFKDDWGEWKYHPYKPFYNNAEGYKRDIMSLNGAVAHLEREKQRIDRERGMWNWKRAVESFDQQEKIIKEMASNAGSHIELQVAKKLLENMNLLKRRK